VGIEVLIVQHAEKVRAAGDPGRTDLGHQQAATVASWLAENRPDIGATWASPVRRAQEAAAPTAAALDLPVETDVRLRERMNWDDGSVISLDGFLAEWRRASEDRSYRPTIGDSSNSAAGRFIEALIDIEQQVREGAVVVVAHGGVTVDALRSLAGDAAVRSAEPGLIDNGVPCCAITRLDVSGGVVTVTSFPSTRHLDATTHHRPA
jgi:broad specificity phosphatase PhoE